MSRFWIVRFWHSFSAAGLLIGTLFFAASLTPTLLPRTFVTQGVLSGVSLAAGYGLGVFGRWLADYLELPGPKDRTVWTIKLVAAVACTIVAVAFLWRASEWQNSIRDLMGLEPVDTAHPLEVGLIALLTFAFLIALARLFQRTFLFISRKLNLFVPKRLSYVVGIVIVIALFWSVIEGVLFRFALRAADSSFQAFDELIEPETQQPSDPNKTGSDASLLAWDELGRAGREFIATGPASTDLRAFSGRDSLEPIRVYVGLRSADTPRTRAKLALEELKRVGGFERSVLIVVTPTGTGWIDPAAMDTVEYLHGGDVASVAIQYSYLTSWLSLLVEPSYGAEAARALFAEVYGHWTKLPRESRPRLYLHGLSLGALSSEQSADLFEVIGDPYHGALWSGPPFPSRIWRAVTGGRNPGSPAWLPRFRDGSYVRFTSQENALAIPGAHWGPMRIVYLQYASDPVTFFEQLSLYREPDWMIAPRGPEVSPELRWYPVVTLLQLALDMAMATTAPMGHGHVYAPEHYIDAWIEVTDVQGWSAEQITRLKREFEERQ
ncbi:alpha/beta hydrolase [Chelativorans xinjiangense]|uniref:alpha/beta hydrolase n=1 Tax=Chelativorans xinjiangense TaxID=2681485 RepID=UPI0013578FA0|nr:alpha/beta-hydrolase family protein [Chelativorans xinjiangense]